MKIIFLDIDGVLNGYGFWEYLGWMIVKKNQHIKDLYLRLTDVSGIHESKVRRLAKVVKKTGAKIVLSSSWRFGIFGRNFEDLSERGKRLVSLFEKYDIEILDVTPKLDGTRGEEILAWLSENEECHAFIILDDENTFLREFDNDARFVQTSAVRPGQMICGNWHERTGLKRKHVRKAIKVLNLGW